MTIHMDCFGASDIGLVRDSNQDQFLIGDLRKSLEVFQTSMDVDDHTQVFGGSKGKLLLVADGMGGHAAGERASTLAVDTLTTYLLNSMHWFYRLHGDNEDDFVEELVEALKNCQQAVLSEGEIFPDRRGMGTTLTIAYIIWPHVYVVHAGDSRCYLIRNRELRQITKDHTVAQQFVDRGELEQEQAEKSKWSNMVWNVLGGNNANLAPQVIQWELQVGDGLLLCTDGLTKHVGDGQILELFQQRSSSQQVCNALVHTANENGGSDNITAVVARFNLSPNQEAVQTETAVDQAAGLTEALPSPTTESLTIR